MVEALGARHLAASAPPAGATTKDPVLGTTRPDIIEWSRALLVQSEQICRWARAACDTARELHACPPHASRIAALPRSR
jgi:hypothetical protein